MRIALILPHTGTLSVLEREEARVTAEAIGRHLQGSQGWDVQLVQPFNSEADISAQASSAVLPSELSTIFERSQEYQIIHSIFDPVPLTFSRMVVTPVMLTVSPGSASRVLPLLERYDQNSEYVSTSAAGRVSHLRYRGTVYPGVETDDITPVEDSSREAVLFAGSGTVGETGEALLKGLTGQGWEVTVLHDEAREVNPDHLGGALKQGAGVRMATVASLSAAQRQSLLARAGVVIATEDDPQWLLPLLEAQAGGTPAVVPGQGALAEVVLPGETAITCTEPDQWKSAWEQAVTLGRLRCREWVQAEYSLDRVAQRYGDLYAQVLEHHKREDRRPWGTYEVLLDDPRHKVKRIFVYPGKRLSLQRHQHRAEHWFVVQGTGKVTLDEEVVAVPQGEAVDIPTGTKHRIENPGEETLIFVEIQRGSYFGEDDIERFEDDFGRS